MPTAADTRLQLEQKLAEEHRFPPLLARVFAGRWHRSQEAASPYLDPVIEKCRGISASPALEEMLALLQRAREKQLPVLFFGDYDADGVISTAMLFQVSQHLGMKSNYYLPSRFNEGYGLSMRVIRIAGEKGYRLLFALDCGTGNLEEVEAAEKLGLEVIGLDHHSPGPEPPRFALVNPHLDRGIDSLCTAGLAFFFVHHWLAAAGGGASTVGQDFLELAAIATIADVVPLVGDSFCLAHLGLAKLPQTQNTGLRALLNALRLGGLEFLTWRDVAFKLVPHINAAGRMAHAKQAAELLLSRDPGSAEPLASQLLHLNTLRRNQQEETYAQASQQALAQADAEVLVLYQPDWNQGVTGVVAAKVAETFAKPVLIFSDLSSASGVAVGSGRAPAGVDLLATMEPARPLFARFGGHASALGGLIKTGELGRLRALLNERRPVACVQTPEAAVAEAEATPDEVGGTEVLRTLAALYPFGEGHPPPRVLIRDARISRVEVIGRDRTHLAISVDRSGQDGPLRIIGFQQSHREHLLRQCRSADLLVELELDNFGNRLAVQPRLQEAYPSQPDGLRSQV